jgi:hypothetical protein
MTLPYSSFAVGMVIASAMLVGCAVAQSPQFVHPVQLRQATPDTSVIYFLRPRSDAVDAKDSPALHVNGRPVAVLRFATYTAVSLVPGKHRVSLDAGPADSRNWNRTADFETKAGETYYVVIWHQRQPRQTSVLLQYGVIGELISQVSNPQTGEHAIRFEQVSRDVAEFAASDLSAVPAAE